MELYLIASDLDHYGAKNNLALLYESGLGTPKDVNKALQLFQEAADQGDITAQYNLGW